MGYTVKQLAILSGITPRTLRYYDEIGLLPAKRTDSNNYRVYGSEQADTLQQILFYRELDIGLDKIKKLLRDPLFDRMKTLQEHLYELQKCRNRIDKLINNVTETISSMKGEKVMKDSEKFEGFKKKLIDDNEEKYGGEIRQRYGEDTVKAANARFKGMSEEKYAAVEKLTKEANDMLAQAYKTGDPKGELAQRTCELHKELICFYWPEGTYTKEAHKGLAQMYADDARFTEYYDKIAPGCAVFLRDAIFCWCENKKD